MQRGAAARRGGSAQQGALLVAFSGAQLRPSPTEGSLNTPRSRTPGGGGGGGATSSPVAASTTLWVLPPSPAAAAAKRLLAHRAQAAAPAPPGAASLLDTTQPMRSMVHTS